MSRLPSLKPTLANLPHRLGPATPQDQDRYRAATQPWRAWYNTARWQALRRQVLVRDRWTCQRTGQLCMGTGNDADAPVINHKVPHRGDKALFWDIDNLEVVSKQVHDTTIQREEIRNATRGGG